MKQVFLKIQENEFTEIRYPSISEIVLQNFINICKKNLNKIENILKDFQDHYVWRIKGLTVPIKDKDINSIDINLTNQNGRILAEILNNDFFKEIQILVTSFSYFLSQPYEDSIKLLKEKIEKIIYSNKKSDLFFNSYDKFLNSLKEIKSDFYLY